MNRRVAVLALFIGLPLAAALTAGICVSRAGLIVVQVDGRGRGGSQISFKVPAAMVHLAVPFIPDCVCANACQDIERFGPAIDAACAELQASPDGVLVEVESRGEWVRVEKKGRALLVNVDDGEETVHVEVPLGVVTSVLKHLHAGSGRFGVIVDPDGRRKI